MYVFFLNDLLGTGILTVPQSSFGNKWSQIRSPGGVTLEVYRNIKGYFSINVQAVTGTNLECYDLVARWPGSTHDSFIYNSSASKQRLNTGVLKGIILGDSGYAVSNVLLTPFLSPNSTAQENYNRSQIKIMWNTVERCFGIWKRRFPCLQLGMGIKMDTVVAVICACATLHNISLQVDDLVPKNWESPHIEDDDVVLSERRESTTNSNGFLVRQSIVDRFFS
nr:LOW QUALITY PROTEIN: uncharacterized protein LOC126054663 [Helicoverpa armigera]